MRPPPWLNRARAPESHTWLKKFCSCSLATLRITGGWAAKVSAMPIKPARRQQRAHLMQSCSKPLVSKCSKPKMSVSPGQILEANRLWPLPQARKDGQPYRGCRCSAGFWSYVSLQAKGKGCAPMRQQNIRDGAGRFWAKTTHRQPGVG